MKRRPFTKQDIFPDEHFRPLDLTELFKWFDSLKPQQTIDTTYEDVTDQNKIESTGREIAKQSTQEVKRLNQ